MSSANESSLGRIQLAGESHRRSYMSEHGTTINPYDALFAGRAVYDVLKELPLGRLQVLPKDYGQSFMR